MPDFLQKRNELSFTFLDASECLNILTPQEQNELIANKTDIVFTAGETIIRRGMAVSNILYLINGLVKLEIINDGKPSTVGIIQSHSFIGIICCFAFENFDFTATALEKTEVSFIDKQIFEKFIKSNYSLKHNSFWLTVE